MSKLFSDETLVHYGIVGQKWGQRRWQYEDGRFNEEGKLRYFGSSKKYDQMLKDSSQVNPNYSKNIKGYSNNCAYCSATYILRRAGFDVSAKPNEKGITEGDTLKLAEKIFNKKIIKDSYYNKNFYKLNTLDDSYKNFDKIINKLKDGESSIISIYNAKKRTGGHYLNAEKIDNNIYIIDSQVNKIYKLDDFKKEFPGWTIAGVTNIDYKQINNINKGGENMSKLLSDETLAHYGILGQKWGERRWQYPDGRFNEEGKERYFGNSDIKINKKIGKDIDKEIQQLFLNEKKFSSKNEFNEQLYELINKKDIYNNYLKPKSSWLEKVANNFANETSRNFGERVGRSLVNFIFD